MTLEDRLQYCRICKNRKLNPATGLVCGLTNEEPEFVGQCPEINIDKEEADRLVKLEKDAVREEYYSGYFASERGALKMGVLGGVIAMVIALGWFIRGWNKGYIYIYPSILFAVGIYALIKGLMNRKISGEKADSKSRNYLRIIRGKTNLKF